LAFEGILGAYRRYRGLSYTVLRYSNVYGPRQDPHGEAGVVAIFLKAIKAGEPIRVNAMRVVGDHGCVRDYVYVADCARANALAVAGNVAETVVNVGTGIETSTYGLARELMKLSGREVKTESTPMRAGDLERSVLDTTLTTKYLGNLVPMAEGLRLTTKSFGL